MNAAETAEEIIGLIRVEIMSLDDDGMRILARRILAYVKPYAAIPEEKPEPVKPMSDSEAGVVGRDLMEFGEFVGQPMNAVPLDRFEWYVDKAREFWMKGHRYLNSPRVKRERSGNDDI